MKIKLKTVVTSIIGISLLAIIGGETYYIVHNNGITKQLSNELAQSENNLKQANILLKEKEENKNVLSDSENIVENNSVENEETKKNKTIEDVIGTYEAEINLMDKKSKNKLTGNYYLVLCDNGTYYYDEGITVPSGHCGNFYIDNNGDIILNPIFRDVSSVGLEVLSNGKTCKLNINEDGSLKEVSENKYDEITYLSDIIFYKKDKEHKLDDTQVYDSLNKWLSTKSDKYIIEYP